MSRLKIDALRCLRDVDVQADPSLNLLLGCNGAGKTSVLEALHCLSSGRSFRSGGQENLVSRGAEAFTVFAELVDANDQTRAMGLQRMRSGWRGRVDGMEVASLGELARLLAVICFEPQSHELISGSGEGRRRLLDLALFHVEPEYLLLWRRFQRALKQRNAALRDRGYARNAEVWEQPLAVAGESLARLRGQWSETLSTWVNSSLSQLLPELGSASLVWRRGWSGDEDLASALRNSRDRDRELGYTVRGPQRSDLKIELSECGGRYELSRGQQKLVALSLLLATASALRERLGQSPIIALDDLPSELDQGKQEACLRWCAGLGAQLWITGTQVPAGLSDWPHSMRRFHVEQGRVSPLL